MNASLMVWKKNSVMKVILENLWAIIYKNIVRIQIFIDADETCSLDNKLCFQIPNPLFTHPHN